MVTGKRNNVVVLSSDGEDSDYSLTSNRSFSKPKSRLLVTRSNPRGAKKARLSGSRPHSSKQSSKFDDIRYYCEDFDEVYNGFKVSAGLQGSNTQGLWVDKYKPRSLEELAVHKKKVEEVKVWFEDRLRSSKEKFSNQVLVITGQAGVGKSATIHTIASHLGARVCEWNTPTPIIWQEHLHNSSTGINYTSKLDEFENFAERIRKYGLIPSSFTGGSKSSVILLIDDLPVMNGKAAFRRLQNCLHLLVQSTRVPTAVLLSDCGKTDSADLTARCFEELRLCLESAGACKVAFNPITHNSIKRTLSRICRQERCNVAADQIDLIANASGGDIRHAITSLQFFCFKPDPMHSLSICYTTTICSREKPDVLRALDDGFSLQFGRDESLSLFHALGKFLHNKRDSENGMELEQAEFIVQERLSRLPLKMHAPEKVLCQAHGQARPIADFLHENVLDFLSEEAIDDAWAVASYLGDADMLLATFRGMLSRYNEAENVLQSAAASVAARGVLFGNSHPLPSRWHSIRRPKLWQIERSLLHNKNEMAKRRFDGCSGINLSDMSIVATEYTPVFKWLGYGTTGGLETHQVSMQLDITEDYFDKMKLEDKESETTDDEIEDW
ncbi:cell cycle checkpoint protein RAD17 [Juglans microcarpa x Juglans regia]|uniref:cell cycle checkpoint protein RAD17 n=1 Tax=Juglans microcarpa x Juglans regia TaxID=2249226 RepID=UPI001B7DD836|nr:cell cycle checkpoint protein RAD17 [Juglans microcarpa x Juglans regia]